MPKKRSGVARAHPHTLNKWLRRQLVKNAAVQATVAQWMPSAATQQVTAVRSTDWVCDFSRLESRFEVGGPEQRQLEPREPLVAPSGRPSPGRVASSPPRCAHWAGSSLAALGVIVNFTVHIERSCRGFCPEHRRRVFARTAGQPRRLQAPVTSQNDDLRGNLEQKGTPCVGSNGMFRSRRRIQVVTFRQVFTPPSTSVFHSISAVLTMSLKTS